MVMTTIVTMLMSVWSIPVVLYIVVPMLVIVTLFVLDLQR
jgi:hypothetical protein